MSTIDDAFPKTPDAVRQDQTNDLLRALHKEMSLMNNNLAIMGQAILKLADAMMEPEPLPVKKEKKNVTKSS